MYPIADWWWCTAETNSLVKQLYCSRRERRVTKAADTFASVTGVFICLLSERGSPPPHPDVQGSHAPCWLSAVPWNSTPPKPTYPQTRSETCLPWLPPKQHLYSLGGAVPKVTSGDTLIVRDSHCCFQCHSALPRNGTGVGNLVLSFPNWFC